MDSSKHVTVRLSVGKCYLLCVCVCVFAHTCEGEGSDLELILHRYLPFID